MHSGISFLKPIYQLKMASERYVYFSTEAPLRIASGALNCIFKGL